MSQFSPEPDAGQETGDEYVACVLRLAPDRDGTWFVHLDGTDASWTVPLAPLTLIVRLWRIRSRGLLRGRIQSPGDEHWIPIQSNTDLEEFVRLWLLSGDAPTEHA